MKIDGATALVAGGASGLGEATVRALVERGASVVIADVNEEKANALAGELGGAATAVGTDVTNEDQVRAAVERAKGLRLAVSCGGVGWPEKAVGRDGAHKLQPFETVVRINLIGMFNVLRHAAAAMGGNEPDEEGERGVVVMTASIAAYDGQIGQAAYAASKGGIVALTLTAARDLADKGIRVVTIAPGTMETPMLASLPEETRAVLEQQVPPPSRLGKPSEYAALVRHILDNQLLNGETIRLDGALRMPPR